MYQLFCLIGDCVSGATYRLLCIDSLILSSISTGAVS